MSETPRRRYRVRLRRAVAGSFLAAAAAASLTGFPATAATAVPPAIVPGADFQGSGDIILRRDGASSVDVTPPVTGASGSTWQEDSQEDRLAGVRADLDRAVLLHLVTPEQADGFYAQIARRVAAGL